MAQPHRLHKFLCIFLQLHDDRGATAFAFRLFNGELAFAVGCPFPCLILTGPPAGNLDHVSDHEAGIEPDAELTDQGDIVVFLTTQRIDEGGGARAGDCAEVLN